MREHDISGVPVVEGDTPVGILTARDIRFEKNLDQPVSALMTQEARHRPARRLQRSRQAAPPPAPDREAPRRRATEARRAHHHQGHPPGRPKPQAVKDANGRLRVGAAIGPGAGPRRANRRARRRRASTCIVVDTAHGHSRGVLDAVRATKKEYPGVRGHRRQRRHRRRRPRRSSTRAPTPSRSASARQHLHHARRRRHRRAADHGHRRLRARGRPAGRARSSPTAA